MEDFDRGPVGGLHLDRELIQPEQDRVEFVEIPGNRVLVVRRAFGKPLKLQDPQQLVRSGNPFGWAAFVVVLSH